MIKVVKVVDTVLEKVLSDFAADGWKLVTVLAFGQIREVYLQKEA